MCYSLFSTLQVVKNAEVGVNLSITTTNLIIPKEQLSLVTKFNLIAVENYNVLDEISILMDQTISENNLSIVSSVLRIERHLRYRMENNQVTGHIFDQGITPDQNSRLENLYRIVKCYGETIKECELLVTNNHRMNCYSFLCLDDTFHNWLLALYVFATQVGLTVMKLDKNEQAPNSLHGSGSADQYCTDKLFSSIYSSDQRNSETFMLTGSFSMTLIITGFRGFLVSKEIKMSEAIVIIVSIPYRIMFIFF